MHIDARIAEIAADQLGLITRAQLLEVGAQPPRIRARVIRGALRRVAPRVYAIGGTPWGWRTELLAGVLSLGDGALVSHRSAAALLGLDGFDAGPLEFSTLLTSRARTATGTVHKRTRLDVVDRMIVDDVFPCTTASRTIIDLAATKISTARLESAIDSAIRDGLSSPTFLRTRLTDLRHVGLAGVRRVDEALIDTGGHSFIERQFLRLVREAKLPRPSTQVIHRRDGKTFARVDFEFAPLPLVVEVSGRRGHVSERERERDARRRNELQAAGFVVLEFTSRDLAQRSSYVTNTVARNVATLSEAKERRH